MDSGDFDGESMMSYNAYSDNDLEELYTDTCSPSINDWEEHVIDNGSPSMDGWDEHYTNTCSPSMEDMMESHIDYGLSSMEDMVESHNDSHISSMEANIHKPSYNKKCDLSSMESDQDYTFIIPSKRDIDKLAKSRDATSSSRRRHKYKSSNFPSSSRRRHNMSTNIHEPHHVDPHEPM